MTQIADDIRSFVVENFLFGQAGDLPGEEESLLENGVIDSTGVLELVTFLEQQFHISVADEELVPDNLDSLRRLTDYVGRKTKENG